MFNGEVCSGREELVEQWGLYFKHMYVPSESPDFDSEWKQVVESTVNETFGLLTPETIQTVIKKLPRGKAGDDDYVVYEHLWNARGCTCVSELVYLYVAMRIYS